MFLHPADKSPTPRSQAKVQTVWEEKVSAGDSLSQAQSSSSGHTGAPVSKRDSALVLMAGEEVGVITLYTE